MTLNSGLRWLRATLGRFRWNGRNCVPICHAFCHSRSRPPSGYPEATLRLTSGQPVGTPRLPTGYPEATLRLPRGYREGLVQGGRNRGLEGRLQVVIPRTNPLKRGRSPRTQTATPRAKAPNATPMSAQCQWNATLTVVARPVHWRYPGEDLDCSSIVPRLFLYC
jgi:hypothetical protein